MSSVKAQNAVNIKYTNTDVNNVWDRKFVHVENTLNKKTGYVTVAILILYFAQKMHPKLHANSLTSLRKIWV